MEDDIRLIVSQPEDCIPIFEAMQREGLTHTVFYDGPVNQGDFEKAMEQAVMIPIYRDGALLAAAWLRDIQGATASLHFCFFDAGRPEAVNIGVKLLRFVFACSKLQSLFGITPKPYRSAVRYITAVGGHILGEVAGACVLHHRGGRVVPAVVSTFIREEYV